MMNRLKFRGKAIQSDPHVKIGDWVWGHGTSSDDDQWWNYSLKEFFHNVETGFISPATVGQWTGLKDKNGVEIYEGDIVRVREDGATKICPECQGDCEVPTSKNTVTRDMAIDAGNPDLEGQFHSFNFDQCQCCGGSGLVDDWGDRSYTIKYHAEDDYAAFDLHPQIDCDCNGLSNYLDVGEIEVIGNIHEEAHDTIQRVEKESEK